MILFLLFAAPVVSWAADTGKKAQIVDGGVNLDRGIVELSFRVADCFTPELEEAVASGVPVTFRFRITLEKPGFPPLFKGNIVETVLEHTIKYDHIRKQYRVSLSEQPEKTLETGDPVAAGKWMSRVERYPVIALKRLEKGKPHLLMVKAELSKFRLPLNLSYIFFFTSLWDFETEWQTVPFNS